jgi:putative ABC transport system permease protein
MPGSVYQYNFLDELNARQYVQEQRWQQVVSVATILAFIICCLGLFGLAHLSTDRRVKEIGIRKVLGASVTNIVALISIDFLKLVFIAFLIAAPVSWIVMDKWLQNFAYRINIGISVFATAVIIAIDTALAATSFQSIKAALANPMKSLRTE